MRHGTRGRPRCESGHGVTPVGALGIAIGTVKVGTELTGPTFSVRQFQPIAPTVALGYFLGYRGTLSVGGPKEGEVDAFSTRLRYKPRGNHVVDSDPAGMGRYDNEFIGATNDAHD